jgi:hypothetical protein
LSVTREGENRGTLHVYATQNMHDLHESGCVQSDMS